MILHASTPIEIIQELEKELRGMTYEGRYCVRITSHTISRMKERNERFKYRSKMIPNPEVLELAR